MIGWLKVLPVRIGEALRVGLWLVPTLLVLGAIGAALGALTFDRRGGRDPIALLIGFGYTGGPEGARQMLSTIATSMMTVAGVSFSVTIVALSLASQQFGPRLLRNFMKDPGNQIVLGTFIATYVYCLVVLRAVRGGEDAPFTPHLAVTGAILLALLGVGVLIYFVHHVSWSIQADTVVARTGDDLDGHIDRIERNGTAGPPGAVEVPDEPPREARAPRSGYIGGIDERALVALAASGNLLVRLRHREGDFCVEGAVVADVWGAAAGPECLARIASAMQLLERRVASRNLEFSLGQLTELAVRSLSAGINDPFTAIACIDRLAGALSRLARLPLEPPLLHDDSGRVRVLRRAMTFDQLVQEAFGPIRRHGARHVSVALRMLDALAAVAEATPPSAHAALRQQGELVLQDVLLAPIAEQDERDVRARHARLMETT